MSLCVFDIDGTLIDSKDVVKLAYKKAGEACGLNGFEMPDAYWGLPWKDWLIDEVWGDEQKAAEIHAEKNRVYPDFMRRLGKVLPAAEIAHELVDDGFLVRFITGASRTAAEAVMKKVALPARHIILTEGNSEQKQDALKLLSSQHEGFGVYVDDDRKLGPLIAEVAGWHYVCPLERDGKPKDGGRLMDEVMRWIA